MTGEEALRLRGSDAAGECVLTFADLLRGWAAADDFFLLGIFGCQPSFNHGDTVGSSSRVKLYIRQGRGVGAGCRPIT